MHVAGHITQVASPLTVYKERVRETLQAQQILPASSRCGKMYKQCNKMAYKLVYRNKQSVFHQIHAICSMPADIVQCSSILRHLLSSTLHQLSGRTANLKASPLINHHCLDQHVNLQTKTACGRRAHRGHKIPKLNDRLLTHAVLLSCHGVLGLWVR